MEESDVPPDVLLEQFALDNPQICWHGRGRRPHAHLPTWGVICFKAFPCQRWRLVVQWFRLNFVTWVTGVVHFSKSILFEFQYLGFFATSENGLFHTWNCVRCVNVAMPSVSVSVTCPVHLHHNAWYVDVLSAVGSLLSLDVLASQASCGLMIRSPIRLATRRGQYVAQLTWQPMRITVCKMLPK